MPYKGTAKKRREQGLCITCGADVHGLATRCRSCQDIENEKSRANYHYKRAHGMCVVCGKMLPPKFTGKLCISCNNKYYESYKKKRREADRIRYERKKD